MSKAPINDMISPMRLMTTALRVWSNVLKDRLPKLARMLVFLLATTSACTACSVDIGTDSSASVSTVMDTGPMSSLDSGPSVQACPATERELFRLADGTLSSRPPCTPSPQTCQYGEECCGGNCYPSRSGGAL